MKFKRGDTFKFTVVLKEIVDEKRATINNRH